MPVFSVYGSTEGLPLFPGTKVKSSLVWDCLGASTMSAVVSAYPIANAFASEPSGRNTRQRKFRVLNTPNTLTEWLPAHLIMNILLLLGSTDTDGPAVLLATCKGFNKLIRKVRGALLLLSYYLFASLILPNTNHNTEQQYQSTLGSCCGMCVLVTAITGRRRRTVTFFRGSPAFRRPTRVRPASSWT